jgi:hypothetical protein
MCNPDVVTVTEYQLQSCLAVPCAQLIWCQLLLVHQNLCHTVLNGQLLHVYGVKGKAKAKLIADLRGMSFCCRASWCSLFSSFTA